MGTLYSLGQTSVVRRGLLKLAISNANAAGNAATLENPEDAIILVDKVVAEIRTVAEAASQLVVGIGDNASDNVLNAAGYLLNTNALNIGHSVTGPAAGINCNCRLSPKGTTTNAFLLVGVDVAANADSLVGDVYVDYIIP
ncbi:MAG: hypothetical protein ABSF21_00870 [Dehalococcoidia bacterium]